MDGNKRMIEIDVWEEIEELMEIDVWEEIKVEVPVNRSKGSNRSTL